MNRAWNIPQSIYWSIPEITRKSWDRKIPYYVRLRDHFAAMIEAGTLAPGTKLPPERALAEEFSIKGGGHYPARRRRKAIRRAGGARR